MDSASKGARSAGMLPIRAAATMKRAVISGFRPTGSCPSSHNFSSNISHFWRSAWPHIAFPWTELVQAFGWERPHAKRNRNLFLCSPSVEMFFFWYRQKRTKKSSAGSTPSTYSAGGRRQRLHRGNRSSIFLHCKILMCSIHSHKTYEIMAITFYCMP